MGHNFSDLMGFEHLGRTVDLVDWRVVPGVLLVPGCREVGCLCSAVVAVENSLLVGCCTGDQVLLYDKRQADALEGFPSLQGLMFDPWLLDAETSLAVVETSLVAAAVGTSYSVEASLTAVVTS